MQPHMQLNATENCKLQRMYGVPLAGPLDCHRINWMQSYATEYNHIQLYMQLKNIRAQTFEWQSDHNLKWIDAGNAAIKKIRIIAKISSNRRSSQWHKLDSFHFKHKSQSQIFHWCSGMVYCIKIMSLVAKYVCPHWLGLGGIKRLAGLERSDWVNCIKNCMRTVTVAKPNAENARPIQEDKSDVHCKNFKLTKMRRQIQDVMACFPQTSVSSITRTAFRFRPRYMLQTWGAQSTDSLSFIRC